MVRKKKVRPGSPNPFPRQTFLKKNERRTVTYDVYMSYFDARWKIGCYTTLNGVVDDNVYEGLPQNWCFI